MDEIKRLQHSADEIDAAIDGLPDFSEFYTKEETDSLLNSKADTVILSAAQDNIAINTCTLGYTRKNVLKVTASTTTKDGITMTVNPGGTVSADQFITVFTTVIAFYFGTQHAKDKEDK
mgnify:CR=1 FL=1